MNKMSFIEFCQLVKVCRMLYGLDFGQKFFEKNIDNYYGLDYASISGSIKPNDSKEV